MSTYETDLQILTRLRNAVDLIMQELHDPDVPMGYFRIMLELMIAHIDTGQNRIDLTQKDLLERTEFEQSSVSRAINAMANSRRTKHAPAYNIVSNVPHVQDRRYRNVSLNPKGLALMRKIVAALR